MRRFIATAWLFFSILEWSLGCTAFCICSDSGNFLAKNLDWPVDAGMILVNRSGVRKTSFPGTGGTLSWTSRYRSLTFNQFGMEFPLGGMNEKGLVVEELNMPSLPIIQGLPGPALNEFQLVQYLLDNFSSVKEIERAMMNFQLAPLLISLHYLVMDRNGRSLIMEFDGTRFQFYRGRDTGIPVLSNNLYPESAAYLKNFQGFGGRMELVHRDGSNERFVWAASMLAEKDAGDPLTRSKQILNAVSQPDTRWSLIYDATRMTVYFRFHGCADWKELPLDRLIHMDPGSTQGADVSDCLPDPCASFHAISPEENRALLKEVYDQLVPEMDLGSRNVLFDRLCTFGNSYL